jgi:predicted ATPase/class 3 adenylate cyclase
MSGLPTGTVTFLFTDIEGSTTLLQDLGDRYAQVLADYRQLLRTACHETDGHEVDTQGDAFFITFRRAKDALAAAVTAQRSIIKHQWPNDVSVRVRMGLHTGEPLSVETGYIGIDVHRAARICAAGHGGQILLSQTTRELLADGLPEGTVLRDLGEYRLKDLASPQRLYQVAALDLPGEFPRLKTLDTLPNNLPRQLTSFVGREREMAEIKRLLSTTDLLTLTGAGGSGKTRLALQTAADLLPSFQDGAWVVEFASLSDPDLVQQMAATATDVREQPGRPILSTLIDYLRPKDLLLLLDNCEHLLSACATLADALLRACPNLRMLATSREGLGISGELTYRVPSLSVPDLRALPSTDRLIDHEAVRLFVERARFALPTFAITEQNGRTVAQICSRLDGIPLAIELAAARMKSMSVERIAERLTNRFRLLTGGSRTALRRHQTLRNAIDWSYDLLSDSERVALRRLAVFAGGFTLEAAEAVCGEDGVEEGDVLGLVTSLVDKSLVMIDQDGRERYRLLEMIREYALDKLVESGESEEVRRRHRDFFLDLAEESYVALPGDASLQWRKRIQDEHDNIRNALRWSVDHEDLEGAARLGSAMSRFWYFRGFFTEGRAWLQELLEKGQSLSTRERAKLLSRMGMLVAAYGSAAEAVRLVEEGLALFSELGDQEEITVSMYRIGSAEMWRGNYERAAALLEKSAARARQEGNHFLFVEALRQRGNVAVRRGEYRLATSLLAESLSHLRRVASKRFSGLALVELGLAKHYQGQSEHAVTLLQEAIVDLRELEDEGLSYALRGLATVLRGMGDLKGAGQAYRESLILASGIGSRSSIIESLVGFAALSAAKGRAERAACLLAAADALQSTTEYALSAAEQDERNHLLEALRRGLGEVDFAAAWADGRAMTVEQAVECALKA